MIEGIPGKVNEMKKVKRSTVSLWEGLESATGHE